MCAQMKPLLVCAALLLVVVLWAAYLAADFLYEDTFECPDPLLCQEPRIQNLPDLPGGGIDPKFSLSPWSIGQRDCEWFSADARRCALPALFSEAPKLCFDMAYWRDKDDKDCMWWTRHVTASDAMWSPRTDGTDPKCNVPPPEKANMTANDILAMKGACCVCGGGLTGRDYAGPTTAPDKGFEPPPAVTPPEQHHGATPTHLTQCCACHAEAVARAVRDQSDARIKEITDNRVKANNPRGGTLTCTKELRVVFSKRRDLLDPLLIGVSTITALLVCCMACVCVFVRGHEDNDADQATGMPLLVRL